MLYWLTLGVRVCGAKCEIVHEKKPDLNEPAVCEKLSETSEKSNSFYESPFVLDRNLIRMDNDSGQCVQVWACPTTTPPPK